MCVGSGSGYSCASPCALPGIFFIFFSSSIRGRQGRKPAGCWRAEQPADADLLNLRRHSQTPVSRPALWQPFPLGKGRRFFFFFLHPLNSPSLCHTGVGAALRENKDRVSGSPPLIHLLDASSRAHLTKPLTNPRQLRIKGPRAR